MLQQDDLLQIEKKGITLKIIENQMDNFHKGFPFIRLLRPAILEDGIFSFEEERKKELIHIFEEESPSLRVIKFVPASGAATRMFKHLFEFKESMTEAGRIPEHYFSDTGFNSVNSFFHNLSHFACYNDLCSSLARNGKNIEKAVSEKDFTLLLDQLLGEDGLNYASLPKALLAFHNYKDGPRSAMEEHLVEAAHYTKDREGVSRIHFTVSPEHLLKFEEKISLIRDKYEHQFNTKLDIQYSIQKSSTDTLAVDETNRPFRLSDGSLLFRPAGHGALLANLNDLEADIIFIKNIDNVVPDRLKTITFDYKKLIGGLLLVIRRKIFDFLKKSDSETIALNDVREMVSYAKSMNLIQLPSEFNQKPLEIQLSTLVQKLNRPIRICGIVRNIGEPGGGPFWVADQNGNASLQIVESSQVNMKDEKQEVTFLASTHFNPVDLVCCTIDYHGKPFILQDFVDESTGFISLKSSGGRTLKAQELPGLWNGSMAGWITLFVEVPILTFNPVKTINDLLRDEHH
jgi:hypothetical protein